ncbi:MAG: hypothetical protein Q4E57_05815 [Eubacteriales bacterium]|nr:hypothetical protein [Eubacteriales bacterium]
MKKSVIFDAGRDMVYRARCIDPECEILEHVSVYNGDEQVIADGVQVFEFYKDRPDKDFYSIAERLAEISGVGKIVRADDEDGSIRVDTSGARRVGHILYLILASLRAKDPELDALCTGKFSFAVK